MSKGGFFCEVTGPAERRLATKKKPPGVKRRLIIFDKRVHSAGKSEGKKGKRREREAKKTKKRDSKDPRRRDRQTVGMDKVGGSRPASNSG